MASPAAHLITRLTSLHPVNTDELLQRGVEMEMTLVSSVTLS
jgi:hypothetical protein